MPHPARSPAAWPAIVLAAAAACHAHTANAQGAPACTARSGASIAPVVELYTSEGCNSCPPADRWLSRLRSQPGVVALAFHVDYWDRLGWTDRFASPAHTRRQALQQAVNGARFSYTPQVVIDGRDRKDWPRVSVGGERPTATVTIAMSRDASGVVATISAADGAPTRLAAYWTVTEFGHRTDVKSGENHGVTLEHDFVVREMLDVPAWSGARGAAHSLHFKPTTRSEGPHPRRVNLVVIDAATGRPVQALALAC